MDNPWATDWDQPTKHSEWPHRAVWMQDSEEEQLDSVSVHEENLHTPEVDDWDTAWGGEPTAARQEKEELERAVPPESLDSLLHRCQQISQEFWPPSENNAQDSWRSGFDNHADITALLAQLLPADSSLPPSVQFSTTATVKAMNEALKLTRHSSAAASSPLSRLLASKGSLEWEKSVKVNQDIGPEMTIAHVGWRVVEKEDRVNSTDDSKPKKATGGLLSFWNRKSSAIQVDTAGERSTSPSLESVMSVSHPGAASLSKPSSPPVPPPPPADTPPTVIATTSAVSRFLNRFSRIKGPQHGSLALSADDLEFLSDVVPSASDPPDEDINDNPLGTLVAANNPSPLPPRLPPPIPPPPRQPTSSSRPSSALAFGAVNGSSMVGGAMANHAPNVPVLAPPLSPKSVASPERTKSPPLFLKDATTPTVTSGRFSTPSIQQWPQPSSQPDSRPQSFFTLPPHQKMPPSLSIPPLLPPPPVSPPQTPRPSTLPSITPGLGQPSAVVSSLFPESHDSDEEFSAFESFPPSASALFPSSEPYSSQDPPSPPPRRTYERTHYPSSSSASSILSPASQTSLDKLCITGSSISASLDSFDDFVSPASAVRNRKHTPSPPALPPQPQPPRVNTFPSRVYHTHNPSQSFASPTVHTSLLNSVFSMPSVSDAEHQRTQTLVDQAASRVGTLWPNSPVSDEPKGMTIPPPSTSPASPKQLNREKEGFDLLGDGDTLGGGLDALPTPINVAGGVRGSVLGSVSRPATIAPRMPFEAAGDPGKGHGFRNQLQPSLPPLPASTPIRSFSNSLATPVLLTARNPGSLQPTKPKQMGGLSAQDLSFFEGL